MKSIYIRTVNNMLPFLSKLYLCIAGRRERRRRKGGVEELTAKERDVNGKESRKTWATCDAVSGDAIVVYMQQASNRDPQVAYIQLSHPLKRHRRSPKEETTYSESQTPVITWFVLDAEGGKNTTG